MRQRTTFFHHNEDAIDPSLIKVKGRSISGPDITSVREDRFTLGLEELPPDLQELLKASSELHLRWSSPLMYDTLGPWTSRLPPGLHVFYTPQKEDPAASSDPICTFVRSVRPLENCSSSLDYFSRLPSDRFSHSSAYQSYLAAETLPFLVEYATQYICSDSDDECKKQILALHHAKAVDLSYDTISHVLKVTVLWAHQKHHLDVTSHPEHRVEVGLLTPGNVADLEDHEIGATGLLTVLGEDTKPASTMFSFPARHKPAGTSFSSQLLTPLGLHPTLQLSISSGVPPLKDAFCSLHAYFTLPKDIFADRYQLEDPLFLASKNLTALRYISQPVDLEAPSYVTKLWGSSLLLELKAQVDADRAFTAQVPLHLRYQVPQAGGEGAFSIPYPAIFWACTSEEGTKFSNSPFDRVNLGYEGLFGPRTLFWHLDPVSTAGSKGLMLNGSIPVLDLNKALPVSPLTGAVVLAGFAWVVWKLLAVFLGSNHATRSTGETSQKKKQ